MNVPGRSCVLGKSLGPILSSSHFRQMNSRFVTNLKYAFQDKETLFLILDLMDGELLLRRWSPCFHQGIARAALNFFAFPPCIPLLPIGFLS